MKMKLKIPQTLDRLNVLLIGNNPKDMGDVLTKLSDVKSRKISTEIAFDLKSIFERLTHFKPHYILIDDNIGKTELGATVSTLTKHRKTKFIPISVLKNSNYNDSFISYDILDFILKPAFSGEILLQALRHTIKYKRTQVYLKQAYKKRKGQFRRIIGV
jgi:PleD family two-component response regulator